MKSNKGQLTRDLAISLLQKTSSNDVFVNQILASALDQSNFSERDRRFVTALVFGVLKHQAYLDQEITKFSTQPLQKLPAYILILLRISIFQLKYMPDMPAFAVLDTSAELAKKHCHKGLVSYVNGLLRNYLRKNPMLAITPVNPTNQTSEQLAISYSMPEWLVKRWIHNFGEQETLFLLDYFNKPPDIVLRTNRQLNSTTGLADFLKSKNIATRTGDLLPDCLIIETYSSDKKNKRNAFRGNPKNLPGYSDNLFILQDEPSAFAAYVLAPESGDFVVDLCAAPGSKTLYLAQLMQNQGCILAIDKNKERFQYLEEKSKQLKLTNIEINIADARSIQLDKLPDKVLLDAPCLGTGVMHKRQDLRHKRTASDLHSLVTLQRQLLTSAAKLVRPGGVIVYSTCSIEPEENIENMHWFISTHPEFSGDDLSPYLPPQTLNNWLEKLVNSEEKEQFISNIKSGLLQILPHKHALSGFFICRLVKKTTN